MTNAVTVGGAAARKPTKRPAKLVPDDAFANAQVSLFQSFLANSDDERRALSNAIDLWDSIPRYSIPRKKEEELRMQGGFLPNRTVEFQYRGTCYRGEIRPARLNVKDKSGKLTGATIEHYPSAREELIEHALRKLAAEKDQGFYDQPDFRSGVAFSLHRLRQELSDQGHSMTFESLTEGLEVLHGATLRLIDASSDPDDPSILSQAYLPALGKVNKKGRASDPDAKWYVQFHGLVTNSINQITYRQFNYQHLMKCSTQLARWLMSQLVLKFTNAGMGTEFKMKFSTIQRDSGLLNGYTRPRDAFAALDLAWAEVRNGGVLTDVKKEEERGVRAKIVDVTYTLTPSRQFATEQKAANRRNLDAREAPRQQPLLEHAKEPRRFGGAR